MGRRRAAPARLPRGAVPRERDPSGRLGRRARSAGRAHTPRLRPLRRATARSARRVDHAAVRAHGAGWQAVRARGCGRQGASLLLAQSDRGERPATRELAVSHRGRRGIRKPGVVRPAATRARAHAGRRRAGRRHGLHRAALAGGVHDVARAVLRGDHGAHRQVGSALRGIRGAAPNAHEELARLLGRLKTPDGKIHIPGLYASVKRPSQLELATWKRLPFKEGEFLKHRVQAKALTGLKAYTVLERLWALPTFEIHGITGGFTGDGAKTVIPAQATAKVSLRLVPNQKLKAVERQLAATVRRLAPKHVQASVKFLHGADPATVKVTHQAFKLLDQAFREVVGRGTVPARAGGSIPVVPALGKGGAPVILTGIGLPDDRLHAPNEKLDLKQLWDGIRVFGRFYELLASL